jgi:hypothetical protein
MEQSLVQNLRVGELLKFLAFQGSETISLRSRKLVALPYFQPDESSLKLHVLFLQEGANILNCKCIMK